MVAELAREDWNDLVAEGLDPTLDDFDRLNVLACRLEKGAESTSANWPRIGWAGDVPFHQPTCAAFSWYLEYAVRAAADVETQNTFWWFALAHARERGFFGALTDPAEIGRRVGEWVAKLPVTREEVLRAAEYAVKGFADARPGVPPRLAEERKRANRDEAAEGLARLQAKMAEAVAKTGLSWDELMRETPSRLDALIEAANVEAGREMRLDEARLSTDYKFALHEIRERLAAEKAAREDATGN